MVTIEKLFYNFSKSIPEVRNDDYLNYDYLNDDYLKCYHKKEEWSVTASYICGRSWKVWLEKCGVEETALNERLGRKVKIPHLVPGGRHAVQTLRDQSFQTNGAHLFNCFCTVSGHIHGTLAWGSNMGQQQRTTVRNNA